jgi:hypothetical protein
MSVNVAAEGRRVPVAHVCYGVALNAGEYEKPSGQPARQRSASRPSARGRPISKNDDLRQRSQGQRWKAICNAAFDQASGAEHADEVTKDFIYTRRETEAVIGIAASLLKSVAGPISQRRPSVNPSA